MKRKQPVFVKPEMKYGRLTIIERAENNKWKESMWLCKCDCGNKLIVRGRDLTTGHTKSCGCLRKETTKNSKHTYIQQKDRETAILKQQYYHQVKRRHIEKKMTGQLIDFETYKKLSLSKCQYCGVEHSKHVKDKISDQKTKRRVSEYVVKMNGIDRIDSSIGYTKENCVPCCSHCNFAKHDMSLNDFHNWIKRVYELNFKG